MCVTTNRRSEYDDEETQRGRATNFSANCVLYFSIQQFITAIFFCLLLLFICYLIPKNVQLPVYTRLTLLWFVIFYFQLKYTHTHSQLVVWTFIFSSFIYDLIFFTNLFCVDFSFCLNGGRWCVQITFTTM